MAINQRDGDMPGDNIEVSPSELARLLAKQKKRITAYCVVDGVPFETVERDGKPHRLYCSNRCHMIAYRQRKREREQPSQPT